ncbi:MAG: cardiolipin synthase B, partial [Chthoniobacterales bacterium]
MGGRNFQRERSPLALRATGACLLSAAVLLSACALGGGQKVTQEVTPIYSAASPEFRQATGALLGGNFVAGNSITTLENGREIFPAMLQAIRSARETINFETYVFWDGKIAK